MAPSLFPVFSISYTFFPHSLAVSHTPLSRPLFVSPPTPSPWFHHGNPSTECLSLPLMAQLLALMHFKRTAAATSQSDGKYMSSSTISVLLSHPILCLCSSVLHFVSTVLQLSDSGHYRPSLETMGDEWLNN